ncbi:MAG: hypothetical protein C0613_12370 [Desulfobulbaceae bacterium]|nr:MAG: hypothetical protein C0613_12370 [Desulfobulbaceae bacterium]
MNLSLADISFSNLFTPELNAVLFALFGLLLVFAGLSVVSIYVAMLPKVLGLPALLRKRRARAAGGDGADEQETLLAIAVALHLHSDFPEENEKITWKSHGEMDSPWKISGRVQGLASRTHTGRSTLMGR